jgi:hypothetical protein
MQRFFIYFQVGTEGRLIQLLKRGNRGYNIERDCLSRVFNSKLGHIGGAMTLSVMTFSVMTLSIMILRVMTLSIMTLRIKTLSVVTLSVMTLSTMAFGITITKCDTQLNGRALLWSVSFMLTYKTLW